MKKQKTLYGVLLFLLSSLTYAQVGPCPPGMSQYPSPNGVPSCGPLRSDYPQVAGHWVDKWGAYVISDDNNGITGWSSNQPDADIANKVAIENCISKGGRRCSVSATYKNSCIAVAASEGGGYWYTDITREIANEKAIKLCEKSGERNCRIFRTECSPAKWIGN